MIWKTNTCTEQVLLKTVKLKFIDLDLLSGSRKKIVIFNLRQESLNKSAISEYLISG